MLRKRLLGRRTLKGALPLVVAFLVGGTSVLLVIFALQWMRPFDFGNFDMAESYTGYTEYVYADDLAKRQPIDIQKDLKTIFEQLVERSEADLFVLKSSDDPCLLSDLIFCRLIPSEKVKPFIEAALAYRQAGQLREASAKSSLISIGSLCVSFVGLIIATLSFLYRKKAS